MSTTLLFSLGAGLVKHITIWVSTFAIVLWLGWVFQYYILGYFEFTWTHERLGQWGDTFGALNALFAAVAFIAVVITISLQQHQISESQKEQHKQRFEGTFFQLLGLLRELRAEISYLTTTKNINKRRKAGRALKGAYEDIKHHLISENPDNNALSKIEVAQIYKRHIHLRSEDGFGPYFRIIYTILRIIDQDKNLSEVEKTKYGNIIRSQLGSPEVALIVLNGLTKDSKDFSDYITRFRIPKYLPNSVVLRAVKPHYDPTAFQERND